MDLLLPHKILVQHRFFMLNKHIMRLKWDRWIHLEPFSAKKCLATRWESPVITDPGFISFICNAAPSWPSSNAGVHTRTTVSAWVTPLPVGQRVSGYWNELELETLQFLFLVLPSFAQYLLPPTSPHHHSITTRNSSWYRGRGSWMRKGPRFLSRKSWAKAGTPRLSAVLHHSAAALSWNTTGTVGAGRMEPPHWLSVTTKCTQVPLTAQPLFGFKTAQISVVTEEEDGEGEAQGVTFSQHCSSSCCTSSSTDWLQWDRTRGFCIVLYSRE